MWPELITAGLSILVAFLLVFLNRKEDNSSGLLPQSAIPTPWSLPFIGHIQHFWKDDFHKVLTEFSEKYGPVVSFRLFHQKCLVVSSPEILRQVYVEQDLDYSGRVPWKQRKGSKFKPFRDIINAEVSPHWKLMRKSVHKGLKMYGDGIPRFEAELWRVVEGLLHAVYKTDERPVDMFTVIQRTMVTFISTLITGLKVERDDAFVEQTINGTGTDVYRVGPANLKFKLLWVAPWLEYFGNDGNSVKTNVRNRIQIVWDEFLLPLKEASDFMENDGLFALLSQLQDEVSDNEDLRFSEEDLRVVLNNIIFTGSMTTTASLYAFFNVAIHQPEVQQKVADEVRSYLGADGQVMLAHKAHLHYTRATVLELLRYSTVTPVAVPRMTTVDTKVANYSVKKGTVVYVNVWHLHHSPDLYKDPYQFKPERFLDENGHILPANHPVRKNMLAFGGGQRVCVGQALTMNRLFIIITTMLQRFSFHLPEGEQLVSCDARDYIYGTVMLQKPYRLVAKSRE